MTPTELLATWSQRVWIEGDLDAIDELFPPSTMAEGMLDFAVGPEDFRALVPAFRAQISDLSFEIVQAVEQGDWLSAQIIITGTSTRLGTPVRFSGQVMVRVEDGRFTAAYNNFHFVTLFEQLELLPANSLALCLAGESPCG